MTHLTSIASRATILNFQVPRGRIIAEIRAEIPIVAIPKMDESKLGKVVSVMSICCALIKSAGWSLSACPQFWVALYCIGGNGESVG